MNLTHKIRLDPTRVQEDYFRRAAGTYRFVFNWALAAWNAEYESGGSPSSKTCSSCGLVKDTLSLGERMYRCECGLEIDRDLNAALNLVQLGEAIAEVTPVETRRRVEEAGTVRCA